MALLPKTASGLVGVLGTSDFYSFTLSATEMVDLDLAVAFGNASLTLYQNTGQGPGIATASASNVGDGWINQTLGAGTYYVQVTGVSSAADAGYTLSVDLGLPAIGTAAASTGGSSLAAAVPAGALSATPVAFAGYVASFATTEYYSFTLGALSTVSATLAGLSANATLVLGDAAGHALTTVGGSSVANASLRQALAAGSYSVAVTGGSSQPTGFGLSLAAAPIAAAGGAAIASAQPLGALGPSAQSVSGAVTPADTANYYSFSLGGAASVAVTLTGITDVATLTLYDSAGRALGSGSASYSNNAVLFRNLAAGDAYYIGVADTSGSTSYTLSAAATPVGNAAGGTAATALDVGTLGATPTRFSGLVGTAIPAADYRIVLTAPTTLNVALDGASGLTGVNAQLVLTDGSGTRIGAAGTASDQGALLASYVLQAGTYDAEVTQANISQDAAYAIGFSAGAVAVGSAAVNSAGTSLATARDIGALTATAATYADFVGPSDPNDYYKFTIAAPSRLSLGVTGLSSNLVVSLQDGTGTELFSAAGNAAAGASLIPELAAGTYYLDVAGANATGYSFSAAATALPVAAGDTLATAASLGALGATAQSVSGFVGPAEPVNDFRFTLAATSRVTLALAGIGTAGSANLTLEDSTGRTITQSFANAGRGGALVQTLAAGTYYAVISQTAATPATGYTLAASATPVVDGAGNSFATAAALGTLDPASGGVLAANAAAASAGGPVAVVDTIANIQASLDSLETVARAGRLTSITATDAGTPTLSVSAVQLAADADAVAKITGRTAIAVTGVTAAGAATQAAAANVASVAVSDSASAVQANLDALETLARAGKLAAIAFTGATPALALTAAQFAADADARAKFTGSYSLAVSGASAASAAATAGAAGVTSVLVSDTASAVQASLDALEGVARSGKLAGITLTGSGTALSVTGGQLAADADALARIGGSVSLTVTGATAAAAAGQVGSASLVAISVVDTMANIQANLDALETLARAGRLTAIAYTDAPSPTLTTSAAQLAADADAVARIGGTFNELVAIRAEANAPLVLNNGVNTVVGVSGNDTITTGTGGTLVFLGPGTASIVAGGADTISGNTGAATIAAASASVLAFALFGPLSFAAGSGASTIVAGAVATTFTGGSGNSLLFSGGSTRYTGGSGTDTIVGQGGSVTVLGGAGGGLYAGGSGGNNQIVTGPGRTTVFGGGAGDVLTASALDSGATALFQGGSGAATLTGAGSRSSNTFFAGTGNQSLVGGAGNNVLVAGNGQDTLSGGSGLTLFSFFRGRFAGAATVQGFDPSHDFVQIAGYANSGAAAGQAARVVNGSAVLSLSDGTQVTFAGVTSIPSFSFI